MAPRWCTNLVFGTHTHTAIRAEGRGRGHGAQSRSQNSTQRCQVGTDQATIRFGTSTLPQRRHCLSASDNLVHTRSREALAHRNYLGRTGMKRGVLTIMKGSSERQAISGIQCEVSDSMPILRKNFEMYYQGSHRRTCIPTSQSEGLTRTAGHEAKKTQVYLASRHHRSSAS